MTRLVLLLSVAALVCAGAASGAVRDHWPEGSYTNYPELDAVVQAISQRPDVRVDCPNEGTWDAPDAWGYVLIGGTDEHMDPLICAADLALLHHDTTGFEDWQLAVSILVTNHESFHQLRWKYRYSEKRVECRAIRTWQTAATLLGADADTAKRLYPWAAAAHFRLALIAPDYYWPRCEVPWPW